MATQSAASLSTNGDATESSTAASNPTESPTPPLATQVCGRVAKAFSFIDTQYAPVLNQPAPDITYGGHADTGKGFACGVYYPQATDSEARLSAEVMTAEEGAKFAATLSKVCIVSNADSSPGQHAQWCVLPPDPPQDAIDVAAVATVPGFVVSIEFRGAATLTAPTETQMVAALKVVLGG